MQLKELEYERYILSTKPVLWLPLYRKGGDVILSSDGFGHVCDVTGTTWGMQGRSLNGSTDFITAGNPLSLRERNNLTVLVWHKINALGTYTMASRFDEVTNAWGLDMNTGNYIARAYKTNATATSVVSATTPETTKFHLVGFTYKFITDGTSELTFYVDGLVDGTPSASAVGPLTSSAVNLDIGRRAAGTTYLNGIISEVWVGNVTFTPNQVNTYYEQSRWRYR